MSSLEQSYLQPQFVQLSFRITPKDQTLILRLFGPSQYFIKCFPLNSNPNLADILSNYSIQQQTHQTVKFHLVQEHTSTDHSQLKKKITKWFDMFQIAVVNYSAINKDKVTKAINYLQEHHQDLKVQWTPGNRHSIHSDCIIYFNRQLKDIVEKVIAHFQRHEHHDVIFPLNWFIKKQIENDHHFAFMQALAKQYNNDLKKIPIREKINHLIVHSVDACHVNKKYKNNQWNKEERNGIYGLQFRVEGFDYEVIQLYSCIEKFFQKITYCVQTLDTAFNCSEDSLTENYIRQRHQNRMLKYIPLSIKQLVIIGSPQLFNKAKADISRTFWTIDPNLFLNLDFSIIKKKQHAYRRFLKQRSIQYQDMLISNNTVTFQADKCNYDRVKYHSKVFLTEYIEDQFKIPFIQTEKQLDIFNKFTIQQSPLSDVELFWQHGNTICRCPVKMTKNMYNHIKDIYEQHKSSMISNVSLKYIKNKYVITEDNPDDLNHLKCIQWRFRPSKRQGDELKIVVRDYQAGAKEEIAIFMVNNPDQCVQIERLVGEEKSARLGASKDKFTLLLVENSPLFQSIVYWKIRLNSNINFDYEGQRLFLELKSILSNSKKPIYFVITREFFRNTMHVLKVLLVNLIESQCLEWKNVTVMISDELTEVERDQFMNFFIRFYRDQYQNQFRIDYRVTTDNIKEICLMKYINFEWDLQFKQDKKTLTLKGSPLNSFIFFWEKQKSNFGEHMIAMVLPKVESRAEILVQMNSYQAFEIVNNEAIALKDTPFVEQIKVMIKILAHYFRHQNYIVLYSDAKKTKLISTVYVYSPKHPHTLSKYKIEKADNTVKSLRENIPFRLELNETDRYRHTTHKEFQAELLKILN